MFSPMISYPGSTDLHKPGAKKNSKDKHIFQFGLKQMAIWKNRF